MVQPTSSTKIGSDAFHKCGEITTAEDVGVRVYVLNCAFCATSYLELESFALHIQEEHPNELKDYFSITEEHETEETSQRCKHVSLANKDCFSFENKGVPVLSTTPTEEIQFTGIFEKCKTSQQNVQDPLDEPPVSILPAEEFATVAEIKCEENIDESMVDSIMNQNDFQYGTDDESNDNIEFSNEDYTSKDNDNYNDMESSSDSDMECDEPENDTDANDKELTLAIIAGYKRHRMLWDINNAMHKNRKKREEAFKKIAYTVNKQLALDLKSRQIGDRIKKMRYKFRTELQNQKVAEQKQESYTPLWYFDKLIFLKNSIKYKQRNKRGAKALSNEKSALPLSNFTDNQNVQLIEIYKSFPCLWDVQHIGFRFKNQRQEALCEMLQAIKNQMNLDLSEHDLQKKLYRIRYACTQEKHRKLQSERIQIEFKPSSKYYEKIAFLEDNVGPFKCSFCDEIFNGADQYKIHKSKHDGSMPFTCPICNRGFMKVGNCTVHLRRHTRDYPFQCKECGKRFATSTDVNVHMRYHTGEKPYFCEVCGQSFRTWTFFDAHMRRHQKRPSHKCSICSKAFYENNKLTEHMKAHLNVRDKICNVCGKAFTSSKYLRQHKQIHAEKKKYSCKICGKDFAQYAGLSGHMKSHGTTVSGAMVEETRKSE